MAYEMHGMHVMVDCRGFKLIREDSYVPEDKNMEYAFTSYCMIRAPVIGTNPAVESLE